MLEYEDYNRSRIIVESLRGIEGLTRDDRASIVALNLTPYESMIVGYLKQANYLLSRDHRLSLHAREETWHKWRHNITLPLNGTLRYREKEPLVQAIVATFALFPGMHPHASLTAYKALDDIIAVSLKGSTPKLERKRRALHPTKQIGHVPLWLKPPDQIVRDTELGPQDRERLVRAGYYEMSGVEFRTVRPDTIIKIVGGVIPIIHRLYDDWRLLLVPLARID